MTCFLDTSALYAVLDADDAHHEAAKAAWIQLLEEQAALLTTSYVLVETLALVQNRLGVDAARVFHEDVFPLVRVEWVDAETHQAAMCGVLSARRKDLSLVDCVSFATMRQLGVDTVFTFDRHFREQGFVCRPSG